jgi:aryl-phospho-beta-D-glucosidase BglC (GH1 family)
MMSSLRFAAILATSGFFLVACGGGGGSGSGSGTSTPSPSTQVALAASAYTVPAVVGSVNVSVERVGGSSGTASTNYTTVNGTAVAGSDYTATSGTVSWNDGDATPKYVTVPIVTSDPGNKMFSVALSNPVGANLGSTTTATVTIVAGGASPDPSFAIKVSGNNLVDGTGHTVQLRGVNVSGLEAVSVMGWSPSNPWGSSTGTPTPDWTTIKSWGANAVRLPLNEASWLGLSCVDYGGIGSVVTNGVKKQNSPGQVVRADPGGNYQTTLLTTVYNATVSGLYVILDLHLAAPGAACPTMQNAMADADHSIAFWTSLASAFKNYPNVIFELFNEPFLDQAPLVGNSPWPVLLNGGGKITDFFAQTPTNPWYTTITYGWKTAGIQQMLDAVRATGATNVVLASSIAYSSALDGWLQYKPNDPAGQLGAVWHAYPGKGYPTQVSCIGLPTCSARIMVDAQNIRAAGYPVVITEYGDVIGGSTSPWASVLLPFADANGISYLGWAWDNWSGMSANVLITNAAGSPTAGYGTYVKAHYLCRAAGNSVCP